MLKVLSPDTDVFVLLCNHYLEQKWSPAEVFVDDFSKSKSMVSVKKTVEKHPTTCSMLIPIHALSGCDTVPMLFSIGKPKALSECID